LHLATADSFALFDSPTPRAGHLAAFFDSMAFSDFGAKSHNAFISALENLPIADLTAGRGQHFGITSEKLVLADIGARFNQALAALYIELLRENESVRGFGQHFIAEVDTNAFSDLPLSRGAHFGFGGDQLRAADFQSSAGAHFALASDRSFTSDRGMQFGRSLTTAVLESLPFGDRSMAVLVRPIAPDHLAIYTVFARVGIYLKQVTILVVIP
jgi:hypothetical protein